MLTACMAVAAMTMSAQNETMDNETVLSLLKEGFSSEEIIGAIENIHKYILAERERGAAILLISLELSEVMELADTIGVIFGGELLKTAPADTMTRNDVGRYMMGVREA